MILVPKVVQFVVVIHKDVTEVNQIEHLKNLCKTHIHVQSTNNPIILNLILEHKRSNGKCVVQVIIKRTYCNIFFISIFILFYLIQKLKGELKSDNTFKLINDLPPQIIEEDKGIPTNLASFKLDLQDNEKKAKDELILPYTLYV